MTLQEDRKGEVGKRPRLVVSLGDPNGVGPEVTLRAARDPRVRAAAEVVAVGSAEVLRTHAEKMDLGPVTALGSITDDLPAEGLAVVDPAPHLDATVAWGEITREGGEQAMRAVAAAADACLDGEAAGMVTGPISKESVQKAGHLVPGHTEFLAERTGTDQVVMVLASERTGSPLRVGLLTIHEPLSRVTDLITEDRIAETLDVLDAGLREHFGIERPRVAVLGLNPHAGDGGVIGREEIEVIKPALEAAQSRGLTVEGPFAADGYFGRRAWARFDATLACYHDQGLGPFKALAMGGGVNVTLGLPIVRTSPDHGTGFDLAGQGRAEAGSMVEALLLAAQMVLARRTGGEAVRGD